MQLPEPSKPAAAEGRIGRGDVLLFAVLVAVSVLPIAADLIRADGLVLPQGAMIGRDFLNAWAGGQLSVHGDVTTIYSIDGYGSALEQMIGHPLDFHAFSYPPTLLLFLWPLGLVPYLPALLAWIALTGAAFLAAARSYLRRLGLPLWVAALLPASIVNIWAGHHGFVLAALWLSAFAAMPRRPAVAGLLIAALTLKPHMGVLLALLLLLRGQWRTIGWAGAGSLALVAASIAAFGIQPWIDYARATAPMQAALLANGSAMYLQMMPTPYVSFWVATHSMPVALAANLLFGAAALTVLVKAALRSTPWRELGLMAATATFLVLPYAFDYDMAVVGLGAAMLLYSNGNSLTTAERLSALLALAAPILVLVTNKAGVPIFPFALLGLLLAQARAYAPADESQLRLRPAC